MSNISVVILNYNSMHDLITCIQNMVEQEGTSISIIIVDNASEAKSVTAIKKWLSEFQSQAVIGAPKDIDAWGVRHSQSPFKAGQIFFIENSINNGYSAGNNIGINLAEKLQSEAVLIVNPDIQINDRHYIEKLANNLFIEKNYYISASRILGLDGKDQNPLREATFWEETLWPLELVKKRITKKTLIFPSDEVQEVAVQKISGCCLMIKMSFLKKIGYLDENVFLYCEEPILSAQVKSENGLIVYDSRITAVHTHRKSEKENASKRMLLFIKSRAYYLKKYSGYNKGQLGLLIISYKCLAFYQYCKLVLKR